MGARSPELEGFVCIAFALYRTQAPELSLIFALHDQKEPNYGFAATFGACEKNT